jgi:homocitrate synthase NifV
VAAVSGRLIPDSKPIVGRRIFTHESGIHVAALITDPRSYQPFSPAEVGASGPVFVAGKHTGSRALQYLLAERGISVHADEARELVGHVRHVAELYKRELTGDELAELCRSLTLAASRT